jgi:NAD(P)-dependent dehydrogenase (short-subunit alcohol dehydrogenase family)
MTQLQGKVAIVTGASAGIGRAIAIDMAKKGASIIVSDINEEGGIETVNIIKASGGNAFFFKADISKVEDNENLVAAAINEYGKLDIACNNAGVGHAVKPLHEITDEEWKFVHDINLSGLFYGLRAQIKAMLAAGGGSIINIGSILSQIGFAGAGAYVAAKHGVMGLTKNAALEYATAGIRVNCVGPAYIKTKLVTDALTPEQVKGLESLHPMERLGSENEIAGLVSFLASSEASFITGAYYPVDGGYLAR